MPDRPRFCRDETTYCVVEEAKDVVAVETNNTN